MGEHSDKSRMLRPGFLGETVGFDKENFTKSFRTRVAGLKVQNPWPG